MAPLKIGMIALMSVLSCIPVNAAPSCHDLFISTTTSEVPGNEKSISERYQQIENTYEQKSEALKRETPNSRGDQFYQNLREKMYYVYRLLQETFYPLMNRLVDRVGAQTTKDTVSRFSELKRDFPVVEAEYSAPSWGSEGIPRIEVPGNPVLAKRINDVLFNNIASGRSRRTTADGRKNEWDGRAFSQATSFLYVQPNRRMVDRFGEGKYDESLYVTMIGEYGAEFSRNLLRTTQIVSEILASDPVFAELSKEAHQKASDLLTNETARGKDAEKEGTSKENMAASSALEGVLSLHQLFATALAKKVQGIDSGEAALKELIFNSGVGREGLVSEFTTMMPMGLIGPMALSGSSFRSSTTQKRRGSTYLPHGHKSVSRPRSFEAPKNKKPMPDGWSS